MPTGVPSGFYFKDNMPRRFTDTEKWKDEWFLSLDNDSRIVWQYILDNCSHAGILKKNFKLLNFCCNTQHTEESFNKIFVDRVLDKDKFYFIPKFLTYQYPKGLNSNKPAIVSVRRELELVGFSTMITQSLGNDYPFIKDKDKDMDKDKDKDKDKGSINKPIKKNEELPKLQFLSTVMLTKEEYQKLIDRFGQEGTDKKIYNLNNGICSKGYKYKSHYHTILSWEAKNEREKVG